MVFELKLIIVLFLAGGVFYYCQKKINENRIVARRLKDLAARARRMEKRSWN